jgi:hypothetical protein
LTVALCLAYVATLIEGASWQGLDNLFLPVAIYLLLDGFLRLNLDYPSIANVGLGSAIALICLTAVGWGIHRATGIAADAMMALITFAYFFWAVGETVLLIPAGLAGVMLLGASLLWHPIDMGRLRGRTVVAICFPICALIIAEIRGAPIELMFSAHVAIAAAVGIVIAGLRFRDRDRAPSPLLGALMGLVAGTIILGVWLLLSGAPEHLLNLTHSAFILGAGVIGGVIGGLPQSKALSESHWLLLNFFTISVAAVAAALL